VTSPSLELASSLSPFPAASTPSAPASCNYSLTLTMA
jgi:hypothetical protein